jgi:hypothetical protein
VVDVPFPCLLHTPGMAKADSDPLFFWGAR